MEIIPIQTRVMQPPKDDVFSLLDDHLNEFKDADVLVVTSKIVAIHQGRCLAMDAVKDKEKLIRSEADYYLPSAIPDWPGVSLKDKTLVAYAGIDESNADGHYILWPENSSAVAKEVVEYVKEKKGFDNFACIIVDSHFTPFRKGAVSISIGAFGLESVIDLVGNKDIFGKPLKFSSTNVIDSIAAAAGYAMGEGKETMPLAIARNWPGIVFTEKDTYTDAFVEPEEDMYYPLFKDLYGK